MKKKFLKFGLVLALSVPMIFTSCKDKGGDDSSEDTEESADEDASSDDEESSDDDSDSGDWVTYTNSAGSYSVDMPGKPEESSQSQPTQVGNIDIHMSMYVDEEKEELYMVGYNDMPDQIAEAIEADPSIVDNMLQGGKQGALGALSKYGSESEVDFEETFDYMDKYPAMKIKAHNGEHYVYAKFFLKDNKRLYQVWKMKIGDYSDPDKADKFFSSFKLDE